MSGVLFSEKIVVLIYGYEHFQVVLKDNGVHSLVVSFPLHLLFCSSILFFLLHLPVQLNRTSENK
jgi:hypothetical protein